MLGKLVALYLLSLAVSCKWSLSARFTSYMNFVHLYLRIRKLSLLAECTTLVTGIVWLISVIWWFNDLINNDWHIVEVSCQAGSFIYTSIRSDIEHVKSILEIIISHSLNSWTLRYSDKITEISWWFDKQKYKGLLNDCKDFSPML